MGGDSEAEMQAGELAALAHQAEGEFATLTHKTQSAPSSGARNKRRPLSSPPGSRLCLPCHPWIKNIKFREGPTVDEIIEQLNLLTKVLPQVVGARAHLHLRSEEMEALLSFSPPEEEELEIRLRRLLRTQ